MSRPRHRHPVKNLRPSALAGLLVLFALPLSRLEAQAAAPQPTCITGVTLGRDAEGAEPVKLVLVDGRIAAILGADEEAPRGVRLIDGEGLRCLPAFVDAYSTTGVETPEPLVDRDIPVDTKGDVRVDMREANRKGIEPSFRASEVLAIEESAGEAWRENGFGVAHVAPSGELLSGTSCAAETREAAMRDLVLVSDVFQNAAFRAGGSGYPNTLMGYIAQLEQFFLDVGHHAELVERFRTGRPGPRPAFDPELDAGATILGGGARVLCEVMGHRDVERWFDLADEFGLDLTVVGDGDTWRAADALAARHVPAILCLDWGKEVKDPDADKKKKEEAEAEEGEEPETSAEAAEEEVEEVAEPAEEVVQEESAETEEEADEDETDWTYREPLDIRRERRRLWEETRDGGLVLHGAGVPLVFGTKDGSPKDLLQHVRDLIEAGFPADSAFESLTTGGAELLGLGQRIGKVEPGYDATLTLWTSDPLTDKKAHVAWIFVEGFGTKFDIPEDDGKDAGAAPDEGLDVSGSWTLNSEGEDGEEIDADMTLEMKEDGAVSGSIVRPNPMEGGNMTIDVEGQLSGSTLNLTGSVEVQGMTVDFEYEFELEGDELSGEASLTVPVMPEPITFEVEGHRNPELR